MPFCSLVLSICSAPRIFNPQITDVGQTKLADAVSKIGNLLKLLLEDISPPQHPFFFKSCTRPLAGGALGGLHFRCVAGSQLPLLS
jgi:hypothetical protein